MKHMHMITHEDDSAVPVGKAALCMNDSGFVGTNNGLPFAGQPALFPEDQASALCYAWNTYDLHSMPAPENVKANVLAWLS